MINLPRTLYEYILKDIKIIAKSLYLEICKSAGEVSGFYCNELDNNARATILLYNLSCTFLKGHKLAPCAKIANLVIPQLETQGSAIFMQLIRLHNYCIQNDSDPESLEKFFDDVMDEIESRIRSIKFLCCRLIRSSNFMHEKFPLVCILAYCAMFSSSKVKGFIVDCITSKRVSILKTASSNVYLNVDTCITTGTTIAFTTCRLEIPFYYRASCEVHLKNLITKGGIVCSYNKFLLEILEVKYGCNFDYLLDCLAKTSLMNPGAEVCPPETEVLVSKDGLKVINHVTGVQCYYNYLDESMVVNYTQPKVYATTTISSSGVNQRVL